MTSTNRFMVGCLVCFLIGPGLNGPVMAQVDIAREAFPDMMAADWSNLARSRSLHQNQILLLGMAQRMPNISKRKWDQYVAEVQAIEAFTFSDAAATPEEFAGSAFRLTGKLSGVSRMTIDEKLSRQFDCEYLYVASVTRSDGSEIDVVTTEIPRAIRLSQVQPEQPVAFPAILITRQDNGRPVVMTPRIEWFPDSGSQALASDGGRMLAAAGMDYGRMDDVRNGSLQAFTATESELFLGLSAAICRLESDANALTGLPVLDAGVLLDLLRKPTDFKGQVLDLRGTVRRVTPIQIESSELATLTGKSVYYHVDLFLPLGTQRFELKDEQGAFTIGGTFGVTLILFELPEGMNSSGNQVWSLPAFFVKNWRHKTVASREVSDDLRRPNPILFGIGSMAQVVDPEESRQSIESAIGWFWAIAIGMVIAIVGFQWQGSRRKRQRLATASESMDFSALDDEPTCD